VGVKFGLLMGVFLAALAVVGRLIGGSEVFGNLHVSVLQVIVFDIRVAAVLGGIVAVSGPVFRTRVGAFCAGCVLALPVALLMGVIRGEGLPKVPLDWFVPVVFALALGGGPGLAFREIFASDERP